MIDLSEDSCLNELSINQISEMEKGTRMTTLEKFPLICRHYKVSADYLLGLSNQDPLYEQRIRRSRFTEEERQAALYFDRATIYLPDFQKAFSMTVKPLEGESYTVECPPDVNGFEYEIREVTKCVRNGQTHSKVFRPQDSVAVLGLLDEIRKSWDMKFSFESAEGAI